jgi:Holliday junction resolvase
MRLYLHKQTKCRNVVFVTTIFGGHSVLLPNNQLKKWYTIQFFITKENTSWYYIDLDFFWKYLMMYVLI